LLQGNLPPPSPELHPGEPLATRSRQNVSQPGRSAVGVFSASAIIDLQAEHSFDVEHWQAGVRSLYRETRRAYRRIGRAILFAFEETVTAAELPPGRVLLPEQLLESLTALGLPLADALVWRQQFLTDVFGFTLFIDHAHGHATEEQRRAILHPVQEDWLEAHPGARAPLSRQALALPPSSADELFERMIDRAIRSIDDALAG